MRAVDHVSFTVSRGENAGLASESGRGKSTVVHALMRTLGPPAVIAGGSVRYLGRELFTMGEEELRPFRWREMAFVFQSAMDALNPVLTVGEQLSDTTNAYENVTPAAARRRGAELLDLVGIDPSGCGFNPRCALVEPRCREVDPPLTVRGKDHLAACHVTDASH